MRYDGFDRQNRWVFPSKTTPGQLNEADYEAYTYDNNGNRLTLRKRDGLTLIYTYDNLNRDTRKTVPELSGLSSMKTRDVFYGYDIKYIQTYHGFDSTTGDGINHIY